MLLSPANLLLVCFMSVYNCVSSFYVETQIDQCAAYLGLGRGLGLRS